MVSVKYVDIVLALVSYLQFSTGYALTVQELQLAHIWLRNRQPVSLRRSNRSHRDDPRHAGLLFARS